MNKNSHSMIEYLSVIKTRCIQQMQEPQLQAKATKGIHKKERKKTGVNKEKGEKEKEKGEKEDVCIIPTMNTISLLTSGKYSAPQLKQMAKHYKLRVTGTKLELLHRVFCFLYLSKHIIKIQTMMRNRMVRKYNQLHGPAYLNRSLCTNSSDFISMEPLSEIQFHQFISYRDKDGFIYGFDICSLYNLIKSDVDIKNPYTRTCIPKEVLKNLKQVIRISRIFKYTINLSLEDDTDKVSEEKVIELRALKLFQFIDSLGNYSNMNWFISLNRSQLTRYIIEMMDIWNYRAQLSTQTKRQICPDARGPFRHLSIQYILSEPNIWNVKKVVLEAMEKLIVHGIDKDNQSLGAFYVLGALTLVSQEAATAMPWLFHSFSF